MAPPDKIPNYLLDYFSSLDERQNKTNALLQQLIELYKQPAGPSAPSVDLYKQPVGSSAPSVDLKKDISNLTSSINNLSLKVGAQRLLIEGKYDTTFKNNTILVPSEKIPFFERSGNGGVISIFIRGNLPEMVGFLSMDERKISFDLPQMRLYEKDEALSQGWFYLRFDNVANIYSIALTPTTYLDYDEKMLLEIQNTNPTDDLTIAQVVIERITF